jgi:hypothetical protein
MTVKEGGSLVARGMAIFFLAESLRFFVTAFVFLPGVGGQRTWSVAASYFAEAGLYFVFAGFLWRGAASFTVGLPGSQGGAPIDQAGLLRALVGGVAVYWLFFFSERVLNQTASMLRSDWTVRYGASLIEDVLMLAISAIVFWRASKGVTLARMISYPRSEPDHDQP